MAFARYQCTFGIAGGSDVQDAKRRSRLEAFICRRSLSSIPELQKAKVRYTVGSGDIFPIRRLPRRDLIPLRRGKLMFDHPFHMDRARKSALGLRFAASGTHLRNMHREGRCDAAKYYASCDIIVSPTLRSGAPARAGAQSRDVGRTLSLAAQVISILGRYEGQLVDELDEFA